jgi:hypothetical protein
LHGTALSLPRNSDGNRESYARARKSVPALVEERLNSSGVCEFGQLLTGADGAHVIWNTSESGEARKRGILKLCALARHVLV